MRVYGNKSVQGLPRDRSIYLAVKERVSAFTEQGQCQEICIFCQKKSIWVYYAQDKTVSRTCIRYREHIRMHNSKL